MEIKQVKIKDLKPAGYNPRKWDKKGIEDLKNSITKFGMVDPIIANSAPKRKGTVIGGHFRLYVAGLLGMAEVPVVWVDIPDEQKEKELNLRLNRNQGKWDYELLAEFDEDFLKEVGFDDNELDDIFDLEQEEDDDFDVDEALAAITTPKAKIGDLWALGEHRVACIDSTDKAAVARLFGDKKAQMAFTDPPYNVNYTGAMNTHTQNKRESIKNDNMSKENFYNFLIEITKRICENCIGGVYICMSSSELESLKRAWEANGGHWQSFIIWVKNNFTLSRADYQNTYEPILYGWPQGIVNHFFSGRRDLANVWEDLQKVKTEFDGEYTSIKFHGFAVKIKGKVEKGFVQRKKQKVDIWRYDKPIVSKLHPTMKPIGLCKEAIINSSRKGDIVMDLFLGSGSTLIAAEKTGRVCYGAELDPKYIDVIVARWEKESGGKAKLIK